ncbi:MAG: hypothetical protein AB1832_16050 [Pseudomonadota bacterium]
MTPSFAIAHRFADALHRAAARAANGLNNRNGNNNRLTRRAIA